MRSVLRITPAIIILFFNNEAVRSQSISSVSPTGAANYLLGSGVTISGVTYSGDPDQICTFSGGASYIGIDEGVALTTGHSSFITGDNTADVGNEAPIDPGTGLYDADLGALSGAGTFGTRNPVALEFDFTATGTTVEFQYVFASEEYNRYAPNAINGCALSTYNDVFGFFISGPNPAGGSYVNTNMATLTPTSSTPVSVNTVNYCFNSSLYVNNCFGETPCAGTYTPVDASWHRPFPYNGRTVVLTAKRSIECTPGSTYHLKLAICNIHDVLLDAAVFVKANSLTSDFHIDNLTVSPAIVCEGSPLTLSVDGSTSYDYTWSDGQSGLGLNTITTTSNLGTTTYSVVATNPATGCQLSESVDVTVHPIDNIPPYINGVNNSGIYELFVQAGQEICFSIPTFDAANENTTISYIGGISEMEVGVPTGGAHKIGNYCWHTQDTDFGDHTFQVQVCDNNACGALCNTYTFTIHVACGFCPVDIYYENRSIGVGHPLPAETKAARFIYAGTSVDPAQTDGPVTVVVGETVDFKAGVNIFLETGFTAVPGSNFTAFITPGTCIQDCYDCCVDWTEFTLDQPLPNVFTPNGDGVNDIWYIHDEDHPYCAFGAQEFDLHIYNRWGNEIYTETQNNVNPEGVYMCCPFQAPSPDNPNPYGTTTPRSAIFWDGTSSGSDPSSEGPYFYVLNLRGCGHEQGYSGGISVFRNFILDPNPPNAQAMAPQGMIFPNQPEYLPDSQSSDIDIAVIPNPASTSFSVAGVTNGGAILFENLKVINHCGEILIDQSNYSTGQTVNITQLSNGVYWIKLHVNGKTFVKPLVKQ